MSIMRHKVVIISALVILSCSAAFMITSAADARERLSDNNHVKPVTHEELRQLLNQKDFAEKYALIDTRTPIEYKINRIPSAVNIPHYKILDDVSVLDRFRDKELIFYCQSGVRVEKVTTLLTALKYNNLSHLKGDISVWKQHNHPLE